MTVKFTLLPDDAERAPGHQGHVVTSYDHLLDTFGEPASSNRLKWNLLFNLDGHEFIAVIAGHDEDTTEWEIMSNDNISQATIHAFLKETYNEHAAR